jgi:hypothetical protein
VSVTEGNLDAADGTPLAAGRNRFHLSKLMPQPRGTLWPLVVALYVRVMERFSMAKSKLTETVRLRISPEDLAQVEAKAAAEDRSISSCLRLLVKAGMSAAGSEQQQAA